MSTLRLFLILFGDYAPALLESFRVPQKEPVTNSSKEKKTHICIWFVQIFGLISWFSLILLSLELAILGLQYPHIDFYIKYLHSNRTNGLSKYLGLFILSILWLILYHTITYKSRLTQKKIAQKKPMLFLASMGKTGLCHDIFFKFSLRPFEVVEVEWHLASKFWGCDLKIWQSFLKLWLLTSKW